MAAQVTATDPARIGGMLVSIGAMKDWQVQDVLLAQRRGDARMFGEIAIALGYIDDAALQRHLQSRGPAQEGAAARVEDRSKS